MARKEAVDTIQSQENQCFSIKNLSIRKLKTSTSRAYHCPESNRSNPNAPRWLNRKASETRPARSRLPDLSPRG